MPYARAVLIRAPLERVWAAWKEPSWLAPRRRVEFRPGGAWEFFWGDDDAVDSTLGCTLLELRPKRLLRFSWQGKGDFLHLFSEPGGRRTVIEVLLEAEEGAVRVTLAAPEGRPGKDWAAYEAWMSKAWELALDELRRTCEGR
ncbi:MAG: SRPBCC domain-containing protein [Elusimicrobia bacterium]|nr:SRPBCC domain-containing protein [Elusimicrobiota bacterium]